MIQNLGNHLIAELYECNTKIINNPQQVERIMQKAVEISGATMVQSVIHKFNPHGVSGVCVIEESHYSIHTWPEYAYCAVDIFTCGTKIDYHSALNYLKKSFQAQNISVSEIKRGLMDLPIKLVHKPDIRKKSRADEKTG